jgi:dolichol-phosphate mannosyltransferase
MADLSDSPEDIIKYYFEIKNNDLDAVLGTRFSSNSLIENYPKKKLFFNRIFNNLVKILYWQKYNDFTNAFKIYKTSVLKELKPIISENFNVFLELPLKIISRKYKYSIIAINWRNRKNGKAKFKIKELGSKYLFTLLYCFLEKILLDKKVKK